MRGPAIDPCGATMETIFIVNVKECSKILF